MTQKGDCIQSQVAMLCQGTETYGVAQVIQMYAQVMPRLRFDCLKDGVLVQWLRERGYDVHVVPGLDRFVMGSSWDVLKLPRILGQARQSAQHVDELLQKLGVRIVHTHWLPQQLIGGFLRKRGYRVVWHIHNNMNPKRIFGLGPKLNQLMAKWGADMILGVSEYTAKPWRPAGVPVRVVRNVSTPLFDISDRKNIAPPPPLRTLIAGRLCESKGHHLAVQAVIAARQAGFDVTLDIFGGPLEHNDYADHLREQIRLADCAEQILLQGHCDDLRERLQDYHLGFQCRIDPEPCSVWVCETLVNGLPLLASATGGTPELVADGITGYLFNPQNPQSLTDALLSLCREPAKLQAMRDAALKRGKESFVPARFLQESEQCYRELLALR